MCPHLFSIVLDSNICVDLEIFFVFNAKCAQSYIGLFINFLWCDPIVGMRRKCLNEVMHDIRYKLLKKPKNAFYIEIFLPQHAFYNLLIHKYTDYRFQCLNYVLSSILHRFREYVVLINRQTPNNIKKGQTRSNYQRKI